MHEYIVHHIIYYLNFIIYLIIARRTRSVSKDNSTEDSGSEEVEISKTPARSLRKDPKYPSKNSSASGSNIFIKQNMLKLM
jgi:hypothetical protein